MSMEAAANPDRLSPFEQVRYGREIIELEGRALLDLAKRLGQDFARAVDLVFRCRGSVIVSGMGKAGLVGQKIMATLASTGTRAHCLHPAEAVHGDLGRIHRDDLMIVLSQSGETEEVVRLIPSLRELGVAVVAVTARADSTLGRAATAVIEIGQVQEACPLGLAPSTSTTAMLAVGDALALVVSRLKGFGREDFARFHPAGSLGRKLSKVDHHMRPLEQCRVAGDGLSVREVFVAVSRPGRRIGAIMLVDGAGRLAGLFTDSDLARLFERKQDRTLDGPIRDVMTRNPVTIALGSRMTEAVTLMARRKISELPVVDAEGRPAGMIDITDVVGMAPEEAMPSADVRAQDPAQPAESPVTYRVYHEPQGEAST